MVEKIIMPTLGLTMTEGTVELWLKEEGETVTKGEPICSISSEKLSNDVEAPVDGILLKKVAQEGDVIPCQEAIGIIGAEGEDISSLLDDSKEPTTQISEKVSEKSKEKESESTKVATRPAGERIFITPLARRIAEEKGYLIEDIPGTGGNGRITRRDVERFVAPTKSSGSSYVSTAGEGLTGMRQVIAKNMHQSLQTTAQVSLHKKADVTELMNFRKEIRQNAGQNLAPGAISLNTLLVKAVSLALRDHPEMNAWYANGQHEELTDIHIGMAVDVPDGLVVPVIKDVKGKSLSEIATTMKKVTTGAQDGTLASDLYSGATFTISNLGHSGIEYFTPVLNNPEVGILGVGSLSSRLAFAEDKQIVERNELPLSLTFDHQVVDGAPAGNFLNTLCQYLENPYSLIV